MTMNPGMSVVVLALLLQACGSSDSPPPISVSPGSADSSMEQVADSVGDSSGADDDESIGDSDSTDVDSVTGGTQPDDSGTNSDAVADNDSNDAPSFCSPLESAEVTYQNYCGFGNEPCPQPRGWFTPQPASGFGWGDDQLCDMSASFGVDTIEVLVPYLANRPDIDGRASYPDPQWVNAAAAGTWGGASYSNDIDNLLHAPVAAYQDGSGYSTWWASHDRTNLYIRVKASNEFDAVPYADSERFYNDDSAVVYIDGDNSKGTEYDGINDFVAIMLAGSTDWLPEIQSNSPEGLGIFYRAGSDGVLFYEIAINLESAGITVGKPFGFDVHINEDDNGGDRDAMWGWFEQSFRDTSWRDPSVLGTLLLTDCEDGSNNCGNNQIVQ